MVFNIGIMVVKIDKAGRIIIPKDLREELDFFPHTELEIVRDGLEVRIRKRKIPRILVENRSGFLVVDFPKERDDSAILKEIREERIDQFL